MKYARALSIPATFILAASSIVACSDDDGSTVNANTTSSSSSSGSSSSSSGTGGAGGAGGGGDEGGSGGAGGSGGGNAAAARVRIAHLSPDAPNVDVCTKGATGDFVGPLLKSLQGTTGLGYSQITRYVDFPAGTYTLRVVAPGAADCATGLLPVDLPGLAFEGGSAYTLAAVGQLLPSAATDKSIEVKTFKDELTATAGKAKLRFIHASPDAPNIDVGIVNGTNFTAVFPNVAFGASPSFETSPLPGITIGVRATGTTDIALTLPGVVVAADEVLTAFAIGNIDSAPKPLKALFCPTDLNATELLSECTVLPVD